MKPIYAAAIQRAAQKVTPMAVAPLRFTNTGDGEATIAFNDVKSNGTQLSIRKSDQSPFKAWDLSAVTLQVGEYIEVVGDTTAATKFIGKFEMTGTIAASGSIMSIVYGEGLTEEQNLVMPAGYNKFCFYQGQPVSLFYGCDSLESAPDLPATTLYDDCYRLLFSGCTGLKSTPSLPAVEVPNGAYRGMFYGCNLIESVILPAYNYGGNSAEQAFYGCNNLKSVQVAFDNWTGFSINWLEQVAAEGTFICPAGLDTTTRDASHVPENWTVVNA